MKKYINLAVSAWAAVLTFVWFALPILTTKLFTASGYEMITFEAGEFKYTLFAICSIALMVVAIAILVLALLNLLVKLNVVKLKLDFAKINRLLLIVATALTVVCLILNFTFLRNGVGIGVGLIIAAIVYVCATVCNFLVKED